MNRAHANSLTRKVQLLAGVFAAGAVAAGMVPLGSKTDVPTTEPIEAPKVVKAPPKVDVDAVALAAAMNSIAPPVKVVEKPVEVETTPVAQPVVSAWKYLGAIISGSYKRAIVYVNEKQHLVAEGSKIGDDEVVEITPTQVKIKDAAGAEQLIDLAVRQRTNLVIASPAGRANGAGGVNANAMMNPSAAAGKRGMDNAQEMYAKLKRIQHERDKIMEMTPEQRHEMGYDDETLRAAGLEEATSGGGKDGKGGGGRTRGNK